MQKCAVTLPYWYHDNIKHESKYCKEYTGINFFSVKLVKFSPKHLKLSFEEISNSKLVMKVNPLKEI